LLASRATYNDDFTHGGVTHGVSHGQFESVD
jgi:hypothetical protein